MKRALLKAGWVENKDQTSSFHHLLYKCKDLQTDYNLMKRGQFFNHFENNKEITTKSELNKVLMGNLSYNVVEKFQPRTFDLGNFKQRGVFWGDFL